MAHSWRRSSSKTNATTCLQQAAAGGLAPMQNETRTADKSGGTTQEHRIGQIRVPQSDEIIVHDVDNADAWIQAEPVEVEA